MRVAAHLLDEATRRVVRQRDDLRPRARRADGLGAFDQRRRRADEHHRLCFGLGQLGRDGAEVGLVAVEFLQQQRLFLDVGKADGGAGGGIGAEGVVDVPHGNAVHADQAQVLDCAFGLALVGGAHVEHVGVHRLVQGHRAGGGPDQRHLELHQRRQHRLRVRRAAAQEQGQSPVLDDQLARVVARQLGVELVVQRHQLDELAVDAAGGVDGIEVQLGAGGGLLHAGGYRAGECGALADHDLRTSGERQREGEQGRRHPAWGGKDEFQHGVFWRVAAWRQPGV